MNTEVSLEDWRQFLDQYLNELIETAEKEGLCEVEVRVGNKALAIRMGQPVEDDLTLPAGHAESTIIEDEAASLVRVKSGHVGTFYRAADTNSPPAAEVGIALDKGVTLGFVESLDVWHQITSESAGVLRQFLIEDGQIVEYGQVIAIIDATV